MILSNEVKESAVDDVLKKFRKNKYLIVVKKKLNEKKKKKDKK